MNCFIKILSWSFDLYLIIQFFLNFVLLISPSIVQKLFNILKFIILSYFERGFMYLVPLFCLSSLCLFWCLFLSHVLFPPENLVTSFPHIILLKKKFSHYCWLVNCSYLHLGINCGILFYFRGLLNLHSCLLL